MDDLPERFWSKVEERPGPLGTPCWYWKAGTYAHGYGGFKMDRRMHSAHILTYRLLIGEVPDGLVLDHLCRVRRCCNPWHLEPVTHRVNILRGENYCADQARKDQCDNGHEFTPENTIGRADNPNSRRCRRCQNDASARYRAKKRAREAA